MHADFAIPEVIVRRFLLVFAALCATARLVADGTPCSDMTDAPPLSTSLKLTAMGGQVQFDYDDLALAVLESDGVVVRTPCGASNGQDCLLVPLYESSSSCTTLNRSPCKEDSRSDDYGFCMVTDELSQMGLILAMSKAPAAVTAFQEWVNTIRALSARSDAKYLPAWRARVTLGAGAATIEPTADDDASDATARIILALSIAAASPPHAGQRAAYEELAGQLANRFAHFDFRDTRNAYGAGRFWPGGGKNAAANAVTNLNPFTFAGYSGDLVLALLAAWQSTGETRYVDRAGDAIANYLRAAGFTGTFRVPPMKFSWIVSSTPPQSVCRDKCDVEPWPGCTDFCDEEKWDLDDAPRAVNLCKAAYYIRLTDAPVDAGVRASLDSYCRAWMANDGIVNGGVDYARQYTWAGTWTGSRSSDYVNAGLGAALNFYLCPLDLKSRLGAAASMYDAGERVFKDEQCIGVYRHAFFVVNYGSAIGRDLAALLPPLQPPSNLTVSPSGVTESLAWQASSGAVAYEVARSCNGETFAVVGTTSGTSWTDTTPRMNGSAYIYKVRALGDAGKRSRFTPPVAALPTPTQSAVPRRSIVAAADLTQLRDAANRLRIAAGLGEKTYASLGTTVQAAHFTELQTDINAARLQLARGSWPFTAIGPGQVISARAIDELRDAVRACPDPNLLQASE